MKNEKGDLHDNKIDANASINTDWIISLRRYDNY
jgi:hypothetical protein